MKTKETYLQELKSLQAKHDAEISELQKSVALENNPYKVGDIVTDHIGSLEIKEIRVYRSYGELPTCIYYGVELKKDGTKKAKQENRPVYQINLRQDQPIIKKN